MDIIKAVPKIIVLLFVSYGVSAQILDPEKVGNRVSKKVERKVDKTVDKSVDKVLDAPEKKVKDKKNPPPPGPVRMIDLYGQLPPEGRSGYGFNLETKTQTPVSGPVESIRQMDLGVPPGVVVPAGTRPVTLIIKAGTYKLADQSNLSEDLWITFLFTGKPGAQSVVKAVFGDCKLNGQVTVLRAAGLQLTECRKSADNPNVYVVSGVFELELAMDKNATCKKSAYSKGVKIGNGFFAGLQLPADSVPEIKGEGSKQ